MQDCDIFAAKLTGLSAAHPMISEQSNNPTEVLVFVIECGKNCFDLIRGEALSE